MQRYEKGTNPYGLVRESKSFIIHIGCQENCMIAHHSIFPNDFKEFRDLIIIQAKLKQAMIVLITSFVSLGPFTCIENTAPFSLAG